ncbi:hypothetical protein QBK99_13680 [Corticibacterium sp. UT-5YL-CI-8]|nr:hypothetical protein [Tianweitania sp. UT-5YL-CI-8]
MKRLWVLISAWLGAVAEVSATFCYAFLDRRVPLMAKALVIPFFISIQIVSAASMAINKYLIFAVGSLIIPANAFLYMKLFLFLTPNDIFDFHYKRSKKWLPLTAYINSFFEISVLFFPIMGVLLYILDS